MRKGKPPRSRHGRPTDRSRAASSAASTSVEPKVGPGVGPGAEPRVESGGNHRIYGLHSVRAALENPARRVQLLSTTEEVAGDLAAALASRRRFPGLKSQIHCETRPRAELARLVPDGAVHQGAVLACEPLAQPSLERLLEGLEGGSADGAARTAPMVILALDQVTDPRNVGAILRSAAAFGAAAVITPRRHAPAESGTLAKAASGALERVPYLQAGNLVQTLDQLQKAGFWSVGLAAEGRERLEALRDHDKLVLVLGAEGSGLRRLTREHCDHLARLPTRAEFGQLNVSAAAAVALYSLLAQR